VARVTESDTLRSLDDEESSDDSPLARVIDLTAAQSTTEQEFLDTVEERFTGAVPTPPWEHRHAGLLVAVDVLTTVLACLPLALVLAARGRPWAPVALIPPLWLLMAAIGRSYEAQRSARIDTQLRQTFENGIRAVALTLAVGFALDWNAPHRPVLASLALLILLPAVGRLAARQVLHGLRRRGHWRHRVVAIGPAEEVCSFAAETAARPEAGLTVVGACTPEDVSQLDLGHEFLPVLGPPELAATAARMTTADCVAVLPDALRRHDVRRLAWELEGTSVQLLVAPALTDVAGPRISIRPMNAFALLHLEQPTFDGVRRLAKHSIDRVLAVLALILLSPVLAVLAVLIRRDSPGGALFRQARVGIGGAPFTCYKFRSMTQDADRQVIDLLHRNEAGGTLFKIRADPRITRLGAALRRYSLDELPQLLNVAKGEMSLVGPRPPLPREVETYPDDVRRRLLVRPGMTGLWQVSGRSDLTWEETIRLDLYYVENWSPLLDFTILWRTLNAVRSARGAY
jgi:exopolysaccharide biosynthesis polyprenyl glycosylphosphotransferase